MSQLRKTVHNEKYPTHIVLIGGLFGGISEILTTYPLDTIKTHLQIYPKKYKNLFHCGNTLVHNYGITSLYKGMYASLAQVGGKAAIRFTVYDYINHILRDNKNDISSGKKMISGLIAGTIESIIWTAPTERIKILQQKNSQKKLCTYKIIQKYGFCNLYTGTFPTIIKQSTSVGTRFWLYEELKEQFMNNGEITPLKTLLIGSLAGGFSTIINHPIDVIKSNIQANEKKVKLSIYQCTKNIIKENGISGLLNGLNARFIRVAIAQGVTFTVYESFISLYKQTTNLN